MKGSLWCESGNVVNGPYPKWFATPTTAATTQAEGRVASMRAGNAHARRGPHPAAHAHLDIRHHRVIAGLGELQALSYRLSAKSIMERAFGTESPLRRFGSIAECVGKGAAIARLVVQGRQQGKNVSWNLGALPPNPRNLALSGQNSCWAWTTREALERRIGLRRNATRAPSQAPEWLGRLPSAP